MIAPVVPVRCVTGRHHRLRHFIGLDDALVRACRGHALDHFVRAPRHERRLHRAGDTVITRTVGPSTRARDLLIVSNAALDAP